MRVCLSCHRASTDDALYCTGCGGMLGKRHCPKGHDVPLAGAFCPKCGSSRLTPGVACWNLGGVPRLILAGVLLVFLAQGVSCTTLPERIFIATTHLLDKVGAWWCRTVCGCLSLAVMFSIIYLLLPEEGRKRLEALLKLWLRALQIAKRGIIAAMKSFAIGRGNPKTK